MAEVLDGIAGELGGLPLALHMAGSYLAEMRYDLSAGGLSGPVAAAGAAPARVAARGLVGSRTGFRPRTTNCTWRTFALSMNQLAGDDANVERPGPAS
ncbi:MAG: hypothetical protein R2911_20000 [Caldilineaceae bacterium]